MFKKLMRKEKGFTMVEMMVVLIIVAVLIAGGIKFYLGYIENSRVTKAKAQISTMQAALDTYYAENGVYPLGAGATNEAKLADLKVKMLNAGLVVTNTTDVNPVGVAGQDGILNMTDPWGSASFYRYHSLNGTKYYIRTGEDTIQGQPAGTAVYGNGSAGVSNQPTAGSPGEPT